MLRMWAIAYVVYVLAVVDWNWSAVRYYLLAVPILWPLVQPIDGEKSPRQRIVVASVLAAFGLVMQWWWIRYCVVVSPELVQVP